jgi:hypothetical protein
MAGLTVPGAAERFWLSERSAHFLWGALGVMWALLFPTVLQLFREGDCATEEKDNLVGSRLVWLAIVAKDFFTGDSLSIMPAFLALVSTKATRVARDKSLAWRNSIRISPIVDIEASRRVEVGRVVSAGSTGVAALSVSGGF